MTGLKSGSGDDLWGDEETNDEEGDEDTSGESAETSSAGSSESASSSGTSGRSSSGVEAVDSTGEPDAPSEFRSDSRERSRGTSGTRTQGEQSHSYIVRRAIQDKSVQFERDERLTFFVHDDVIEGERDLVTELESTLGRDVPKFDVREAVYRAALRNQDDVLEELLAMGYTRED
ncbi:hypothetical protein [Halostagnicola kamekurae]|uniref:Uncharacterized protein n=1 Tax=Halostagnicola kamekurae TaxID=619731 RepID=A0A1I6TJE2_9EURY|nr:hypothetical protein [Halostagnicola kamekurae]SFS89276.1 hypothetical protein SAMN04488556_3159 [Halostagnicola kamekurae]